MTGQLRADARRNRDQILAAARDLLVEQGVGVPMEEVARRAGVGVGTLYRRFPDRLALLRAVSLDTVEQMRDLARSALATEPSGWDALSRFVHDCVKLRLGVLKSTVDPRLFKQIANDEEVTSVRIELLSTVETMMLAAQRDGVMRDDVGVGDVAVLVTLHLKQPLELPSRTDHEIAARLTQLMLDGLRARSASTLVGRPITLADVRDHIAR
jgi:AcrR family transcriptional regulator